MSTIVFPRNLREKIGEDNSGDYPHIRISTKTKNLELDTIHLYAPQGLSVGDGANYNGLDLGTIRGVKNVVADSVDKQLALGTDAGLVMGIKIAKEFGANEELAGAAGLAKGVAFNQQTALTFEGMNLRAFNFNFTLIPESADESKDIRKIENFFRKYMYSEVDNFVAKFPEKFTIKFYDGARENPFMPFIHECFLSGFETTYNPDSNMYYNVQDVDPKTGNLVDYKAPASVSMSLTFSEARVLSRQDIYGLDKNGNGFNENLMYDYNRETNMRGGTSKNDEEAFRSADNTVDVGGEKTDASTGTSSAPESP